MTDSASPVESDQRRVRLEIPGAPEYVVLARLAVSGIASRMGASYDDIEDLKVIAAETCRMLIGEDADSGGVVRITYAVDGQNLIIDAERTDDSDVADEPDELALHLLDALADEHEIEPNGQPRVHVVKHIAR